MVIYCLKYRPSIIDWFKSVPDQDLRYLVIFSDVSNPYITTRNRWQKQKHKNKDLNTTRTHLLRCKLI